MNVNYMSSDVLRRSPDNIIVYLKKLFLDIMKNRVDDPEMDYIHYKLPNCNTYIIDLEKLVLWIKKNWPYTMKDDTMFAIVRESLRAVCRAEFLRLVFGNRDKKAYYRSMMQDNSRHEEECKPLRPTVIDEPDGIKERPFFLPRRKKTPSALPVFNGAKDANGIPITESVSKEDVFYNDCLNDKFNDVPQRLPLKRIIVDDDDDFYDDDDVLDSAVDDNFDDDDDYSDDEICDKDKTDEQGSKVHSKNAILSQEGTAEDNDELRNAIFTAHETKNIILPDGSMVSSDGCVTRTNNNFIVLGTSGGGKTRSMVIPNILSATESMIISDPKGSLYEYYGDYLRSYGYRVVRLDLINPEESCGYNPLDYVQTSDDIMCLAHQICFADGPSLSYDPFWDRSTELLLSAIIGLLVEQREMYMIYPDKVNIHEVITLLDKIDAAKMEEEQTCELDSEFIVHSEQYYSLANQESWAYRQWIKFRHVADKTFNSVIMTANAMLARIDTTGIRKMMSNDNVELCKIGSELTAIFVEISDTDRSKDLLANVFYSQAMSELCRSADNQPDHRLSVPVRFILDDFGTTSNIAGFENMISNIRSRRISAMIVIQSLSQLERRYGESSHTIIDNCDTMLYMGGNDVDTAEYIAKRCNKSLGTILSMPVGRHWQFRRGQKPKFCNTEDLSVYSFRCREEDNAAC